MTKITRSIAPAATAALSFRKARQVTDHPERIDTCRVSWGGTVSSSVLSIPSASTAPLHLVRRTVQNIYRPATRILGFTRPWITSEARLANVNTVAVSSTQACTTGTSLAAIEL